MHYSHYNPAIAARKQKNSDVFADTMRICRAEAYTAPSGAVVRLPATDDVLKSSVFYQNPPRVDDIASGAGTMYDAVNEDCIETARKLVEDGYRPIMLNMANRHTPGGGVIYGARAQEESLFRQSNLCVSLYQFDEWHADLLGVPLGNGRYPMDRNTGGIYSGRVTFFRTSSRNGDALVETPFECAVVSVAAINRPDLDSDGRLVDWAVRATKSKIRTMLRIGLLHGHDAIVLGAWGCGAFCNPPEHMAQLFREVLLEEEFADKYRIVRFAVIEDHNSRNSNFAPFDREFNKGAVRCTDTALLDPSFPDELTAEMLANFKTTPRGCTHPRVGEIDGHRFIAKCGSWSEYSSDGHVHNEFVADNLLRAAGLNVPLSREYHVDFGDGRGRQIVRLAVYGDTLKPIMEVWNGADADLRARIRAQAVVAYPVQALVAGIDTFTWDNVKVDPEGNLWFVDNGASFDFRACGKLKGWFWERHDVDDPRSGYLSLAKHPDQCDLRRILGKVDDAELWTAAKNCHFMRLVEQLPEKYRSRELIDYAAMLEAAADKNINNSKGKTKMDRNKAKGMLWGLIVGDAFGSPIQFSGKDSHPWITEMVECPVFGLPPGYWTDDGSMAMCIMDSYVRKGKYALKDIGDTFVKWFMDGHLSSKDGESFDVGGATWNACQNIALRHKYVNGREDSQGNGSIMRFAPAYLLAQKESDPAKVMHEISDLTHNSNRVREVVDRFAKVLDEHMAGIRTDEISPYKTREEVNNSGWAVSTLDAALWAFNTTESFEEGLIAAVNLGGDSDSIGAVFGQIAGAYYGFDSIPERWVKAVKTWETVDALIERFLDAVEGVFKKDEKVEKTPCG